MSEPRTCETCGTELELGEMLEACIDYHFTNGYPVMAEIAMDSRDYCSYDCMLEGQLERLEELQDAIQEDDIVEVLTDMANGRGYE